MPLACNATSYFLQRTALFWHSYHISERSSGVLNAPVAFAPCAIARSRTQGKFRHSAIEQRTTGRVSVSDEQLEGYSFSTLSPSAWGGEQALEAVLPSMFEVCDGAEGSEDRDDEIVTCGPATGLGFAAIATLPRVSGANGGWLLFNRSNNSEISKSFSSISRRTLDSLRDNGRDSRLLKESWRFLIAFWIVASAMTKINCHRRRQGRLRATDMPAMEKLCLQATASRA